MNATSSAAPATPAETAACAFCGAALQADQEWCLECGVARTTLRRAAAPMLPVAAAALVVTAAVVVFSVWLSNLGSVPAPVRPAQRLAAHTTPAAAGSTIKTRSTTTTTRTLPSARETGLESWPAGLSGWTVALATTPEESVARRDARALAAGGLSGVGVLDTSQHPHMHAGDWIVFSHRYPSAAGAQTAAAKLAAAGHEGAYAIEVAPPGGI